MLCLVTISIFYDKKNTARAGNFYVSGRANTLKDSVQKF